MELTAADRAAFDGRPREIDYDRREQLHYLGEYRRELPNNLQRMMENAYDWEHLPFVHPTSFADIELIEQGSWGWRCKAALPNNGGTQAVELLVDKPRHYWATTVVEGFGQGVEIHTQASENGAGGIVVSVNFYLPQPPESEAQGQMLLAALTHQYATLYNEDEALMTGRQAALDRFRNRAASGIPAGTALAEIAELDRELPNRLEHEGAPIVIRWHEGEWIAHSALCPHMLGPLDSASVEDGAVVCPWHGYRFALSDGEEERRRCGKLPVLVRLEEKDGRLVAAPAGVRRSTT
ncbi:Rieske (2Fe-2S) protein [Qipengyuania gelatinilytica]|uniref:Rieske (2Fe-2S) protein n=1 Tax=Qipengyuania gelatinilytica TaxID=2867231 RepID=A0ABX9A2P5_9SPHN|nr:Rieske (2Fe-2S) protein [Qipengyuania gelatinilytica]QZD94564.1 Rieske (2Fe-2S) protein [Qipengyuania gelatinilytica]